MRKFLILSALAVVLLIPTVASASPHDYIKAAINSVCRVEIIEDGQTIGSGSGFVVGQTKSKTTIITARHVLDTASNLCIVLNGKKYMTAKFFMLDTTDAGVIFVEPGIPHARALAFNLSASNKITRANAFGFWGRAKIPGKEQQLTMTSGWVDRKVVDEYSAPDYQLIRGLIFGNVLIYPGYSGGPLLDNNMRILGVNIMLSPRHTMYVDGRYLWNQVAQLNRGRKAHVPIDYNYDVLNTGYHTRERIAINDFVVNDGQETSIATLKDMLQKDVWDNGQPGYPAFARPLPSEEIQALLSSDTMIIMGDKAYLISAVAIMGRGLKTVGMQTTHPPCMKYVYIVVHGGEIIIELADVPADNSPVKEVKKTGVFFKRLGRRHF